MSSELDMYLQHFQILKHNCPNIPGFIQTQTENGYTCVFSDASASLRERSEISSHIPSENATSLGIVHLAINTRVLPGSNRKPMPSEIIRLIYLSTLG